MLLHNYYCWLLTFFILFMKCNYVENNGPKDFVYENIYLAKDVVSSQIKRKFLEILSYIILKKPRDNKANRQYNFKEQDIAPKCAIVLLKNIQEATVKVNHTANGKMSGKQRKIPKFRKDDRKIVKVIVDDKIMMDTVAREGLSIEHSRESIPKKSIERSTPNILREKYGDACIKVAVRKCYKALLAVNKNFCKFRYKCKSSFKSYFKSKSKVGCIKEFDYSKGNDVKQNNNSYYFFRDHTFVDATREGYLDSCIPFMVPNYKVTRRIITLRNDSMANVFANVLRKSKSDKKCQRLSRTKCYRACSFAMTEACTKYDCSSRRKRIFSKTCKEECKRAYQVLSTSDSSESSGSD